MTESLRYIFWILLSIPVLIIGLCLFRALFKNVRERYEAEQSVRREKELAEQRRREFEESYSRRRGGGGN